MLALGETRRVRNVAAGDLIRVAIVGYGRIAPKHLEVLRAQGADVVACCNRSPEGRRRAEVDGQIPRTYSAIAEMLERERPHGVICCASLENSYQVARAVLPFGIPTLLEKPPGTSWEEYASLCALRKQFGTPVIVGLNRRHYSVVRGALAEAGGCSAVTAVFVEWSENPRHFLDRGMTLDHVSRMVFGNTLHGLDLITFLAGDIPAPVVIGRSLGEPKRWTMALTGTAVHGAMVTFNSTWDSPGRWRVSFCVPGKRYILAPLESCQVLQVGSDEPRQIQPDVGSSRVDLQACKLEYSIVSPK